MVSTAASGKSNRVYRPEGGSSLALGAHGSSAFITEASTDWELEDVKLTFALGSLRLAALRLRLHRRSASLAEPALGPADDPAPPASLKGAVGYVVWSQPMATRVPPIRWRERSLVYVPRQYRRFLIDLAGDFDSYLARFSAKTRSTIKRKLRRFADACGGTIDAREYRTPAEIAEFLTLAHEVSAKSYQARLLDMGLPEGADFCGAAQRLAEKDMLRAYLLFFKGKPISYLFCPISDGIVLYDYVGYDPAHAEFSPGMILQVEALKALFAEKQHRLFDFTEGEGAHKKLFATHDVLCADVFVIQRRPIASASIILHRSHVAVVSALGAFFDRMGLRARLRRLLRSR